MCGEHAWKIRVRPSDGGSSPHVRGAQRHQGHGGGPAGIIPACAGSTCRQQAYSTRSRDHPRMCGEHMIRPFPQTHGMGSSPHVRGAHFIHLQLDDRAGIIPACAGSTLTSISTTSACRDHPRMCGEHAWGIAICPRSKGSSPHVRGALAVD